MSMPKKDLRHRLVLQEQARHIQELVEAIALLLMRYGPVLEPELKLAKVADSQLQDLVDELRP